ncbi:MAG: S46 family peptidase, partial [Rhodothermales bacterium]
VLDVLDGRSPEEAAVYVLETSALSMAESAASSITQGTLSMDDSAVQVAAAIFPRLQAYRSGLAGLGAQEQEIASRLGRGRFEVYGTDVPPDATFSLRIADGIVKGYPYNGTIAPPYTTIYGIYDHYYSYGPDTPWDLPSNWLTPSAELDMATPLNFVSTNDIIGGNSGSPVVNEDLELVGLIFDGNIESLSGDFIYLTERGRAVSVDARGIREALDDVYGADRIVIELTTGRMIRTEEEADAMRTE